MYSEEFDLAAFRELSDQPKSSSYKSRSPLLPMRQKFLTNNLLPIFNFYLNESLLPNSLAAYHGQIAQTRYVCRGACDLPYPKSSNDERAAPLLLYQNQHFEQADDHDNSKCFRFCLALLNTQSKWYFLYWNMWEYDYLRFHHFVSPLYSLFSPLQNIFGILVVYHQICHNSLNKILYLPYVLILINLFDITNSTSSLSGIHGKRSLLPSPYTTTNSGSICLIISRNPILK